MSRKDQEEELLRSVSLQNASAIHAARQRAEEALREQSSVLELLNETGAAIASQLDLPALVQTVTDAGTKLTGAKFGAFDPTFKGERVVRSPDITKDPRYGTMEPHHGMPKGHLPVRSYLAVPVVSRSSEVIGGLFFGHPDPGVFSERAERIIVGVAAQAAVAIDNARLYEAAQKAAAERNVLLENERAARAEVERLNEMKDEFLANLSHELRTPLGSILGWAHILRQLAKDQPELRQGLETIERNARAQAQLIEDLLDMSRITSGKVRLDIQPIAPIAFIEAALQTVKPAADAKGIRVQTVLDPAAGPIHGDPARLQQVVWNLLSNAIKFTPKDGKVQIILQRVNSHIEISVTDSGIGIKPQFVPHVFERFRQADGSSTRRYGGLGLGLSIVKNLVELHGGTVRAESKGEDRGATFSVHLPLTAVQPGAVAGEDRQHPRSAPSALPEFKTVDLSGIKVLVVDDEPDARNLIKRVLRDCNAQVVTAGSAREALLLVDTEKPHVLVSDIGMPDMDGYELLKRVRALRHASEAPLPAIALTAFARSEDRTRALRAGFLLHLSKPVEPSELVATVASAAGRTGEHL